MMTTPPMPRIALETVDQATERLFSYLANLTGAESYPLGKDGILPRPITDAWLQVHHIEPVLLQRAALHHGLRLEISDAAYTFALDWETF